MTDAFHAGVGIDDINGVFGNGFGRAFRKAGAAGNAIIINFHSHRETLLNLNLVALLILFKEPDVK